MSVRQDQVQIHIDFITDESRQFAKTILDTKKYNQEIDQSRKKIADYEKELKKVGEDETKRLALLGKIAKEELNVAVNQGKIADAAKRTAAIDLSKLTPAQLVERAKQLEQAMRHIPQTAPQYRQLQTELATINTQLTTMRNNARGVTASSGSGGGLGQLAGIAGRIAVGFAAAVGAVRGFLSGLSGSAKLEQLNIAFETFLGSADKAKKVVADLKAFEVETPFEADQVNQAGRALLAFGFNTKELIPTLRAVGDVASGTGKDFNELVLIYGKARAEGRIQNDTLNQLAEAGIPIYQELAKVLKVPEAQIRKLAEQGKIGFNDLQTVFKNLTSEGGRFAGLMERQSKSLDGLFSTLSSAFGAKVTGLMNDLLPLIKSVTQGFIDLLSTPVSEKLEDERQAFNGLALSVLNATQGTEERRKGIKRLQDQYPEYLGSLDAEKVTNEQLKPILDRINQSYIIRIALQKQQENLQPLLEAQAARELKLAEGRAGLNRQIARGAELVGLNLQAYGSQKEQLDAVLASLAKVAQFQEAAGFRRPLNEQAKALLELQRATGQLDVATIRQGAGVDRVTKAEQQRKEVVEELKKAYGDLVDSVIEGEQKTGLSDPGKTQAETAEQTAKRIKAALDAALQEVEANSLRREVVLENSRLKDEIDETKYQQRLLDLKKQKLQEQLDVYKLFRKEESVEALKARNELLQLEAETNLELIRGLSKRQQELKASRVVAPIATTRATGVQSNADVDTQRALEAIDLGEDVKLQLLKEKFELALIAEQDFELAKLEVKRAALEEELAVLRAAEKPQRELIEKKEDALLKIEEDYAKKRLENAQRLEDLRAQAQQEGLKATADVFQVAAELLSQDEKRKQKHAGVVKALEIANVQVNLFAEVSGIFANAQKSAVAKLFGPIAGNILAGIQAASAAVRAGIAIGKIQAQKFSRGGMPKIGFFGGRPHSSGGTRGVFDDGTEIEVERDEAFAVVNKHNAPLLRGLSWLNSLGGRGVPYFARGGMLRYDTGGLTTVNTTPTGSFNPATAGAGAAGFDFTRFETAVGMFERVVAAFPRRVEADVPYAKIRERAAELSTVEADASI
jgi:tape measure domain-containing protein